MPELGGLIAQAGGGGNPCTRNGASDESRQGLPPPRVHGRGPADSRSQAAEACLARPGYSSSQGRKRHLGGLGRKPRARVSDVPNKGRGTSRALTFRRRVLWGSGGGRHRGRRRGRRRRSRRGCLVGGRCRVSLGIRVGVGIPARRAAPRTWWRKLQDGPAAGYRPGLLPHREPERELRASAVQRGGRTGPRCVINIHGPRRRLPRGAAANRHGALRLRMRAEPGRLGGRSAPRMEGGVGLARGNGDWLF